MDPLYIFEAKIWKYNAKDPWYFVTVPAEHTPEIKALTSYLSNKGFGTVKVKANIGNTSWDTSIFPDKKSSSYLMPVKKEIRSLLHLDAGDTIQVSISITNL